MNTILVGNGAILKDMGTFIDSFDEVVRMNQFTLEGYEDHVGKRTSTIICHNALEEMIASSIGEGHAPIVIADIPSIINMRISEGKLNNIDGGFYQCARVWCGTDTTPTTGMAAIIYLIMTRGPIALIGFDEAKSGHYWATKHTHTPGHAWEGQRSMINHFKNIDLLDEF